MTTLAAPGRPGLDSPRGQVLRAVLRKQKLLLGLLLPVILIPLLVAYKGRADAAWTVFGMLVLGALQAVWWSVYMALLAQNHPNAARLVPLQLLRLREVAVGLFLLLAVLSGLLGELALDRGLPVMLFAAVGMLGYAVMMRWPWLWVGVWFVPATTFWWRQAEAWKFVSGALWFWHQNQPVLQSVMLMVLMMAALWHLLLAGGARHARHWKRARALRQSMSVDTWGGKAWMVQTDARGWRWLQQLFGWLRPLWLNHLLRHAGPTPRSALARAEVVAMRGVHWSTILGVLLTVLGLGLVAALLTGQLWTVAWERVLAHGSVGLSMGVMSMMVNPTLSAGTSLYQSRREQALLLLLPGMPRGQALNRHFTRRMLLQFLACWGLATALVLLVTQGPQEPVSPGFGLIYAALMLPMGLVLVRNWARQGAPRGSMLAVLVLGALAVLGGLMWLHRGLGVPAEAILAGSAVLSALGVAWRWHAMRRWPTAWPTGRWA